MKILLTGGAGFIGSHVAEAYIAAGHQVIAVDDLSSGSKENIPPGAVFYLMNINAQELIKVFKQEKPDVVNHHAAQISVTVSARNPLLDAQVNALGLLNVLECSRASGVKKVIFISSGGAIYGETTEDRVTEDHPALPLSPYAIHKLTGENYLRFYNRQYGSRFTVLRYANVYGPRQDPHGEAGVVSIFINKLLAGETPTLNAFPEDPDGMSRDYVFVEDAARANLLALEKGEGQAMNIASAKPLKTRHLLEAICRAMGKEPNFIRAGPRPGDIRKSCLDNGKALAVLGWQPSHTLEDGLRKTVSYFRGRMA
jgi:UDP-glucose 4-epimerase